MEIFTAQAFTEAATKLAEQHLVIATGRDTAGKPAAFACSLAELLVAFATPVPLPDPPEFVTRYATDNLRIREQANITAKQIGVLAKGAAVHVIPSDQRFWKIADAPGYVANDYLGFDAPVPPPAPEPEPQQPTDSPLMNASKIGFHIMPGNNQDGLIALMRECYIHNKAVRGVTLVRMGWQSELTPSQIKQASPFTKVLQRWYHAEWEGLTSAIDWSRADLFQAGINLAQTYYSRFLHDESQQSVDWHQTLNEPSYGVGTPSFWLGAMQEADRLGFKLAVGCFAVGNPQLPTESPFWGSMYAVLRYANDHGHALMLHEYTMPDGDQDWLNEWYIQRYRKVYATFPSELQGLPLILGEYGQRFLAGVGSDYLIGKLKLVQPVLAVDHQVLFASLWTYGGGGAWADDLLDKHLPELASYYGII